MDQKPKSNSQEEVLVESKNEVLNDKEKLFQLKDKLLEYKMKNPISPEEMKRLEKEIDELETRLNIRPEYFSETKTK